MTDEFAAPTIESVEFGTFDAGTAIESTACRLPGESAIRDCDCTCTCRSDRRPLSTGKSVSATERIVVESLTGTGAGAVSSFAG